MSKFIPFSMESPAFIACWTKDGTMEEEAAGLNRARKH